MKATLLAAEPQLFTTDLEASIAFYTNHLGFQIVFTYGSPPFYAQVARDRASLNLRQLDEVPSRSLDEELLAATVTVDNIDALNEEFQAAATPFHQPLRLESWGARTFVIRDPDKNLILFAGK